MKPNPYIYPVIFCGMLEVVAFVACKLLFPTEDITVIMGVITLGIGQIITFLINASQAEMASQRAELATQQAEAARKQVHEVSKQIENVDNKASESQITSRTGLSALVKSEDLVEFDRLADSFSKTTLTYPETLRFIQLLEERLQDDLTIQQLTAAKRIIEITQKELQSPEIHDKPHIPQSEEELQLSRRIQRLAEEQQRNTGARKEGVGEQANAGSLTVSSVAAAASAAAASAERTKVLTEQVVVQAAKEIEKDRKEK